MSVSAIFVAVLLPVLGAIADQRGPRKPWLFFFTIVAVVATACLWFARPDTNYVLMALIMAGLANFAFEAGVVFYNSMLPDIAPNKKIARRRTKRNYKRRCDRSGKGPSWSCVQNPYRSSGTIFTRA
jgi:UMF1 family MFS transporter